MTALDPLIYEFETEQDKAAYEAWLHEKVRRARQSRRLTDEEVQEDLAQRRAEWLESLKYGAHA